MEEEAPSDIIKSNKLDIRMYYYKIKFNNLLNKIYSKDYGVSRRKHYKTSFSEMIHKIVCIDMHAYIQGHVVSQFERGKHEKQYENEK